MDITKQGFLIKKGNQIKVNCNLTSSVLLNNLNVDLLIKNSQFISGYLLDAGCGEKPYSLIYNELVEKSIGCDVEHCIHDQKEVDIFASIDKLPFESELFDTVLCTNVLEHVAEIDKAFSELTRVLKRGGNLIISVPFLYPVHEAPYDFYRFTVHGLNYLLNKNDMKLVKFMPWGGIGLLLIVNCNLFICKLLRIKLITKINCFFQEKFYKLYKKIYFKDNLAYEEKKISKTIALGYFVIAKKSL